MGTVTDWMPTLFFIFILTLAVALPSFVLAIKWAIERWFKKEEDNWMGVL